MSAIIYRFPERPRAGADNGASFVAGFHQARRGRCAEDYRRVLTRLMAAGVASDRTLADVLNLSAIHTPDGAAWDDATVRRLRRELGLVS